jgi:putative Holliday junction resolvase
LRKSKRLAKIIALDIGGKRTGIAETDPMQIIASPRETVLTKELETYLLNWLKQEEVETIVIGDPLGLDGGDSDNSALVLEWETKLKGMFPAIPIFRQDERFTSKMAMKSLVQSGMKKKKRREKGKRRNYFRRFHAK